MTRGDCLFGALLLLVALLLQVTVLYQAAPGGITIDLVFLVTVALGSLRGAWLGALMGFCGGLMMGAGAQAGLEMPLSLAYASVGIAAPLFGRRILLGTLLLAVWLLVLETVLLQAMHIPHAMHLESAAGLALYLGCLGLPVRALVRLAWRLTLPA